MRQILAVVAVVFLTLLPRQASSMPLFARRFDLSCGACHTTVPHLNPFGQAFLRSGFRLPPQVPTHATIPLTVKVNVQYSSAPDPTTLPKTILDELEFLSAGALTSRVSYRVEQYAVDGGLPGSTRDAWLNYTSDGEFGQRTELDATAGEFTLPLPVDPETQRPTQSHYLVFDQTVGSNPFNFFDDRIGIDGEYGRQVDGLIVGALAMRGHDPQSGLPTDGLDTMLVAARSSVPAVYTAYWYRGQRPLRPFADAFTREGIGATYDWGKAQFDFLGQLGFDSSADGRRDGVASSGGFAQARWYFSPSLFGVARYDTASDGLSGADMSETAGLVFRPYRNASLSVEKVFGFRHNAVNAAWLFAY